MEREVRILIADDNRILCELLEERLNSEVDYRVVAVADDVSTTKEFLAAVDIDLVLLDYSLPIGGGVDVISCIKSTYERIKVLVFSVYDDEDTAHSAISAGADGFITKSSDLSLLSKAIAAIQSGQSGVCYGVTPEGKDKLSKLSEREKEVLVLLASGYSNRLIAKELYISLKTVEAHKSKLKEKTGISTVSGLVKLAIREGLISSKL